MLLCSKLFCFDSRTGVGDVRIALHGGDRRGSAVSYSSLVQLNLTVTVIKSMRSVINERQ